MRAQELIERKKHGQALTETEIQALMRAYVDGDVPDYQMSAFAMAVCFQGMTAVETTALTMAMANSGDTLDLSSIPGIKVDKHSTGGVGDTTTLVLGPLVAAVGVPVAKMSGRGLGHTGGTLDKLESIPGFSTQLGTEQFMEQVRAVGVAVASQTANLAPADKKLYALRDVTGTVQSMPLIASSIMSKKIASGADAIVLDVKVGDGAFMKTLDDARTLADTMVQIGALAGRSTTAVLTPMDEPLGRAIGNALEVREAIETLRGDGPADLTELCLVLGSEMVVQAGRAKTVEEARAMLETVLKNGKALDAFRAFVQAQGGDPRVADNTDLLPQAPTTVVYHAPKDGYIKELAAEELGLVAMRLGAGRATKDAEINHAVGLVLQKKVGDAVTTGTPLVHIHAQSQEDAARALMEIEHCIAIAHEPVTRSPLVLDIRRQADTMNAGHQPTDTEALVEQARKAHERAYVPYSRFGVGAALLFTDGRVVRGNNVENASYGLTNCAERTAIFRAIAEGVLTPDNPIAALAVIADSEGPVAPCGACRQVLAEFCSPDMPVTLADFQCGRKQTTMSGLLPYAFGPAQMERVETGGK